MVTPIKCPNCTDGVMNLPAATTSLTPNYTQKRGAKLVCKKCGYRASPQQVRQAKDRN